DYTNKSNQFISLVKGEYGHTPVAIDPAFREKITGSPVESPYDVSKYVKPENPEIADLGGKKLASNNEEYLLLELLPAVAKGFLRCRRDEEFKAEESAKVPETVVEETVIEESAPITGPVISAPMCGRIVDIKVKPGQRVKKGDTVIVYEAMKMENDVESDVDGVVKRIFVSLDEQVGNDAPMIEFEG
ncbi:MAG: biotin/lipoyl-binding protein, partial [Duncaniella sp.]|nr:biotin/lipoyl-binding protein [Duncaniella sp.]